MSGRFLGQLKISVHRMSWLLRPGNGATWSVVGEVLALMMEEVRSDVKTIFSWLNKEPTLGKPHRFRQQVGSRMKKRVKFVVEVMDHVLESVPKEEEWVSRISAVYQSMIVLVLLPHSMENNL